MSASDALHNQLTAERDQHLEVMRLIAQSFSNTPMVLKGGTGLYLGYGLDRFSEDLDFDSTVGINVEARIKEVLRKTLYKLEKIVVKKDTETVKRWMVSYSGKAGARSLKIEVSLRSESIDADTHELLDGIRIYKIESLIDQKLNAVAHRAKVRDLYDLKFMAEHYADRFSDSQAQALLKFASDPGDIVALYKEDHGQDPILKEVDLDELALDLLDHAENLHGRF
ncbi:MAG: nucleotidyl transferase AbiEii/AbiGii toxin family protein [Hahellaceae bacterium]|nr:nucleotidyl transferase AbiEii/AbiGii toxin family protein [Hahellaceae bacterium]